MKLTDKDIEKACELSKIALTKEEQAVIKNELGTIFDWIDKLSEIDVSKVDIHEKDTQARMVENNDTVDTQSYAAEVLKNAPLASHNMFAVPKVIE